MKLIITVTKNGEVWDVQAAEEKQDDTTFTDRITALALARRVVEQAERKISEEAAFDD